MSLFTTCVRLFFVIGGVQCESGKEISLLIEPYELES